MAKERGGRMSILIPNMDFPQSCNDCPMNYDSIDCTAKFEISLRNAEHEFLYEDKRHPDCPLIEYDADGTEAYIKNLQDTMAELVEELEKVESEE